MVWSGGAGGAGAHPWERAGGARRHRRTLNIVCLRRAPAAARMLKAAGLSPGLDCGLI